MLEYGDVMAGYIRELELALPGYLPRADCRQKRVCDAMAYSLLGGGKRIRGVLTLAVYHLFRGGELRSAVPFGAAVEMVHAYSLIHDDLPCMDDSDLRRGRPACHIQFGEAVALLAGDGLLSLAFEAMSMPENLEHFSPSQVLCAIQALARASGAQGMVGGQVIDLESENASVSLEELRDMDDKKTGALFRAAVEMGCILGGAEQSRRRAALRYAGSLGLAFQVIDDILDVCGDAVRMGKPSGADQEHGKSTYVSLLGLDGARRVAAELGEDAKAALAELPGDSSFLRQLTDALFSRIA